VCRSCGLPPLGFYSEINSDQEFFEQQVTGWTSSTLEKIQSRGYWHVITRPDTFSQERFAYKDLFPLVQRLAVDLHGDDFPNVLPECSPIRGRDFISQEIEAGQFLEAWKIYQSGQFLHYSGMVDDWLDQGGWLQPPEGWQAGEKLAVEEVVRQFTGIFVFASRLALTDAYVQDNYVHINVLIKGLQGRKLYISSPRKVPLRWNYQADIAEYPYEIRLQRAELIANAASLVLQASKEFFYRLGWEASLASLESTQANYYKGS
jgi:hypothetical protein